jgi:integrase
MAERLNAEVDAYHAGKIERAGPAEGSIAWLIARYQADGVYRGLADKTKRSYDQCIEVIKSWSGDAPLTEITRRLVKDFYRSMERTPYKANAVIRVLRILYGFAVDEGLTPENPVQRPRLVTLDPRGVFWSDDNVAEFVDKATELGRSSMALAVLLGAGLGQREGDILRLGWTQYDGTAVHLRQRKTHKLIAVPVAADLKAVLDGAPRSSPTIVVSEATQRPYKEDHFRHEFARIRKAAALGDLRFMDLRRTAVVWLARAECTVPEIAAVTGHEIDRTAKILETYLPRDSKVAANAVAKLEEWRRNEKR